MKARAGTFTLGPAWEEAGLQVKGWLFGPHIATFNRKAAMPDVYGSPWPVIHLPTGGIVIGSYSKKAHAFAFARTISDLKGVPWATKNKKLLADRALAAGVPDISVKVREGEITEDAEPTYTYEVSEGALAREFEYGVWARPILSGGSPEKGWVRTRKSSNPRFKHGVLVYDRPLTSAEVRRYDLVPLDPRDPMNMKKARDLFDAHLMDVYSDKDIYVVELGGGRQYVLHPSTRPGVEWQVTHFFGGKPTGHIDHTDWDKLSAETWNVLPRSERERWMEKVTPKG